jgi:carbon-monoxide dehydrogenase medium subunit
MYATNYHRPSSVDEAAKLLSGEAKILAGGQTLLPAMKLHLAGPSDLVDIRRIAALKGIRVDGSRLVIGAATTHFEVAHSAEVRKTIPALARLAGWIGDPAVRHVGTIGGSIANNDPAADYPAGLLGLGATVVTNRREIKADDFFTGLFSTALEDNEIVTAVRFPVPKRAGYEKLRHPASRFALVGVMVAETAGGIRVAVTGSGANGVFRAREFEAALARNFAVSALDDLAIATDGIMSDIHGDAAYRAHLIKVIAQRAVDACSPV